LHKIPVTVITGFLGAGKTTIVRHLLQNNQGKKIAVLVNEFGEIGIDGELLRSCQVCDDIIELTNGCLCCTVQEEFYPTMQQLLKRREEIDCILIETSGLALPKPLIQAFRWQEIRNGATVDGVVTVVDARAIADGNLVGDLDKLLKMRETDDNLEHETPLEELFEDQLACADLVLLTKTDLLDESTLNRVKDWLQQQLPPGVKILPIQQGLITPELLLGFNAGVEDDLDNRPSHHDHEEDHEHDDGINSVHLILNQGFDPESLVTKLQELVKQQEIYRVKGFVNVPHKPMRLVLQGVGNRFDTFYDRLWLNTDTRETRLVFIGKQLESDFLEKALFSNL